MRPLRAKRSGLQQFKASSAFRPSQEKHCQLGRKREAEMKMTSNMGKLIMRRRDRELAEEMDKEREKKRKRGSKKRLDEHDTCEIFRSLSLEKKRLKRLKKR